MTHSLPITLFLKHITNVECLDKLVEALGRSSMVLQLLDCVLSLSGKSWDEGEEHGHEQELPILFAGMMDMGIGAQPLVQLGIPPERPPEFFHVLLEICFWQYLGVVVLDSLSFLAVCCLFTWKLS